MEFETKTLQFKINENLLEVQRLMKCKEPIVENMNEAI